MTKAIEEVNSTWEYKSSARTATVLRAIEEAKEVISNAETTKLEALDAEEKEIRWAISSIYNMGVQNELNTALTYAREDANKECKRLTETAYEALEEIEKSWTSHVIQLSISLSETAREAEAKCEVTKIEQE